MIRVLDHMNVRSKTSNEINALFFNYLRTLNHVINIIIIGSFAIDLKKYNHKTKLFMISILYLYILTLF